MSFQMSTYYYFLSLRLKVDMRLKVDSRYGKQ